MEQQQAPSTNIRPFTPRPPTKRKSPKVERGIQRTPFGYRAWVRVKGIPRSSKRFPTTAGLKEMRDWRANERIDLLRKAKKREADTPQPGTFAEEVTKYLRGVRAMPTYQARERHMHLWLEKLGRDRSISSIDPNEIRAALSEWLRNPMPIRKHDRDPVTGKPIIRIVVGSKGYSESECNKRRTALMHFFSSQPNGKNAPNPVREVTKFREPDAQPRGVPLDIARRILNAMPDSKSKARASVHLFTTIPPEQIRTIEAHHFDANARTVFVQRRSKGKGTKSYIKKLDKVPEAVAAFKSMAKWDAWGYFSTAPLNRAVKAAAAKVRAQGVPVPADFHLYDLRHSFLTQMGLDGGDQRAVQAYADHKDIRTTDRYTLGAVDARVSAALAAMQQNRKKPRAKKARGRGRRKGANQGR